MNEIETQRIRELLDSLINEHQTWVNNLTPLRASIEDKIALVNTPLEEKIATLTQEKEEAIAHVNSLAVQMDEMIVIPKISETPIE